MGLILITLISLVVGIVLVEKYDHEGLQVLGMLMSVIGGMTLLVFILVLASNPISFADGIREYHTDKEAYIETIYDVDVTGYERVEAIKLMLSYNHKITKHKNRLNNFWTNWFFSKKIAELELFDISKIKKSNIGLSDKELNEF